MRFVPVKSEESQATLMLHKTRELLIKCRKSGGLRSPADQWWLDAPPSPCACGDLCR
jgi:hypothetical protein